jgi:hypothetical protein
VSALGGALALLALVLLVGVLLVEPLGKRRGMRM